MTTSPSEWLKGSMTALVTPFGVDGEVDHDTFARLIERQIAAGTHALIPAGTTGESTGLTIKEHIAVIATCVKLTDSRVPVIAGVGSNETRTSIELARIAEDHGADALLASTGYYNRPSQAGLIAHYTALADATSLPLILYNVPARTANDILVPTMATLSRHPKIVGVKDATANLARVARQRLECEPGFIQLSGEDATVVGFNAMGGLGVISVTANVVPDLCAQLQNACLAGEWQKALELQDRLTPLSDALFTDTSPGPVKYALAKLGLIHESLRLPLVPASETARKAVDQALANLDLI